MNFDIPQEIIDYTTECQKCFACLNQELYCKVKGSLETECLQTEHCNYKIEYTEGYICKCPIRLEVWRKYQV